MLLSSPPRYCAGVCTRGSRRVMVSLKDVLSMSFSWLVGGAGPAVFGPEERNCYCEMSGERCLPGVAASRMTAANETDAAPGETSANQAGSATDSVVARFGSGRFGHGLVVNVDDLNDSHFHPRPMHDEAEGVEQVAIDQGICVLEKVGLVLYGIALQEVVSACRQINDALFNNV